MKYYQRKRSAGMKWLAFNCFKYSFINRVVFIKNGVYLYLRKEDWLFVWYFILADIKNTNLSTFQLRKELISMLIKMRNGKSYLVDLFIIVPHSGLLVLKVHLSYFVIHWYMLGLFSNKMVYTSSILVMS